MVAGALHSRTCPSAPPGLAAGDELGDGARGGRAGAERPAPAAVRAPRRPCGARRCSRVRGAGERRDGCGRRRGGGGPSLLVQGGAAGGRLRGEDVAGAALLREQVQRQAHHHFAGAGPREREVAPGAPTPPGPRGLGRHGLLVRGSHISGLSPPPWDGPCELALRTLGVLAAWRRKDRPLGGAGKGPEKSPVTRLRRSWRPHPWASFSPSFYFRLGPRCLHFCGHHLSPPPFFRCLFLSE